MNENINPNNENQTQDIPVQVNAAKPKGAGRKLISFSGVRWDRMTDSEIANQVFNDPKNKGVIRTNSLKNFHITVYLKRKKLIAEGRKAAFAGRTVVGKDGTKVKRTKWVHSKKSNVVA